VARGGWRQAAAGSDGGVEVTARAGEVNGTRVVERQGEVRS
jgi:hypothetical protein